jgi:hypothetical protein
MFKVVCSGLLCLFFSVSLNANEVFSYSLMKYKADFNKQNEQSKDALIKEYSKLKNLAQVLEASVMKDDIDLEVAKNMLVVDIWTNKFLQSYKPTTNELNELYKVEKPRAVAKYELRNILVSYENNADRIIGILNDIKNKTEKKDSFIKYVRSVSNDVATKQNNGLTPLVDENKLSPQIKEALKGKKEGDIVKVNLKDVGTQILYIEKYIPEKKATFEEAKEALIDLAKRKALTRQMELLSK